MSKQSLRRLVRLRKYRLTFEERQEQSLEIMRLLEALPAFQESHTILLYASMPDEVQTIDFIQRWYQEKNILLPVVKGDDLELRRCTGCETLLKSGYGILEPHGEEVFTDYETIDLAIIPGVGFTLDGKRLGRGKGFYDRLLSNPQFTNVYKIGIAFPCQIFSELPVNPHDVILDKVLSAFSVNSTLKNP